MAPQKIHRQVNYQEALREIAKSLVRLKRPERLLKMITRFLSRELGLTYAAILVFNPAKAHFTVFDSRGIRRIPRSLVKFDREHPLIQWFQMKDKETETLRDYLTKSRIQAALANGLIKKRPDLQQPLSQLDRIMKDLRADIAIPGHFKDVLVGILLLGEKLSRRLFTKTEINFFQTLVHDVAIAVKTTEYNQRLIERNIELEGKKRELEDRLKEIERFRKKEKDTYYQIMKSLAQEIHAKDPYTFGHIRQVEELGLMCAEELGLELDTEKKAILSAGLLLHDVGKIGIPDHILKKPACLDKEEWKIMRTHVEKGVKILEPLSDFRQAAEIVHCHHENFDGSGYPRGLKGDQIPIEARIVSVVDAFHAIVSTRCYREGRPIETAFEELRRCSHTQFDPRVVDAFVRGMKKQLKRK